MSSRRCRDYGLLLSLLIGAFAAWPFLARAGLPRMTDAELHVFRIAELGASLRAGNLYPRWAPDFFYGYGYPIFNYYAPLVYHLGNWLTLLHPLAAMEGAKAVFVLSFLLGAGGAYLLGREFGGQGGGVLGAAAFVFSPYVLLFDPHIRGDLAETFAVSLLPLTLWSWERLWQGGGRGSLIGAVSFTSAVLLSHNLTGLTCLALVAGVSLWHWLVLGQKERVGWAILGGGLVTLLTAFFWLPFLAERHFIKLNVAGEGHYDFHNHLVLFKELLAPLPPVDWGAAAPHLPNTAGPVILLVAVFGFIATLRRPGAKRRLFYLLAAAASLWLVSAASVPLWERLPGLGYYQFPWRFLGPLAALLVPLVASLGKAFRPGVKRAVVLTLALLGIIMASLPGLYPPPWDGDFGDVSAVGLLSTELAGRWRGTTSTDDFVPSTVEMIPKPQESLLDSYRHPPVDRVNRYTLPEGAEVRVIPDVPWCNHFVVNTPKKFLLRLYLFDFPGWTAYVDGAQVPITIAHPEGFVTLSVPSGQHQVVVRFEDTPVRTLGWILAGLGVVLTWLAWRHFPRSSGGESAELESRSLVWLTLGLLGLAIFKVTLADAQPWFHYRSPPGEAIPAQFHQRADFGGEIALLGFDVSARRPSRDGILRVTLYWAAQHPMTETYQSFVHLVSPEGQVVAQSDHLNPGGFPTDLWDPTRYVWDEHQLSIPATAAPGMYHLSVGIYKLQDNTRLPVQGTKTDHLSLKLPIVIPPFR